MRTRALFIVLLLGLAAALSANPLLGGGKRKPVPAVRPPSSQGLFAEQQLAFRDHLADFMDSAANKGGGAAAVLGLAFLYGLFHAAGPGHRKTVIFSIFLSRRSRWFEPGTAALVAAAAHGGTALLLVLVFRLIYDRLLSVHLSAAGSWMEGISFLLLTLFALFFFIKSVLEFRRGGHSHGDSGGRGIYLPLLTAGLFPCPGVIMILTFAAALGILKLGIMAVIAVSLGMGVTISAAGYLAYFGREGLFSLMKEREEAVGRIAGVLECGSYLFLLLFCLWMVLPFLGSLFRMAGLGV